MKIYFDHEKLDVYREAIGFCGWVGDLLNDITSQEQRQKISSTAPRQASAEYRRREMGNFRCQRSGPIFRIARGSALSAQHVWMCSSCESLQCSEQVVLAKERLSRIVKMLIGLLRKVLRTSRGRSCAKMKEHILTSMIDRSRS